MKVLPSFTHSHVAPNMTDFFLQNIKEDILKNVGNSFDFSLNYTFNKFKRIRGSKK